MSIKTKKDALSAIKCRRHTVNGREYTVWDAYLGTNDITKKPVRLYAKTKKELELAIDDHYRQRAVSGDFSTVLTAEQILDAKNAIYALSEAKVNISLLECAKREIDRSMSVSSQNMKVSSAYKEFFSSKQDGWDKEKTRFTTGKWVSMLGDITLGEITIQSVAEYLKTHYDASAPKTYNSQLTYIRTFLNWCANPARGYLLKNPIIHLELKPEQWKRPNYLKPEMVERLMRALESVKDRFPERLALAVTQLFVGVRRQEALRIAEDDSAATILIEDETFRVEKGKGFTRGRSPRTAKLESNALAWMRSFDYLSALRRITPNTTQMLYDFASDHGVKMFQNCMRHTFITMHVAKYHTPEVTQSFVGTGGNMRAKNYDGLAPEREGIAYFNINPTTSSSSPSEPPHPPSDGIQEVCS